MADIAVKITVNDRGSVTKVKAFGKGLKTLATAADRAAKSTDKLTKKTRTFSQAVTTAGMRIQSAAVSMRTMGTNLTMMAAPIALVGAAIIKTAADFDTSMTKIETLVGVNRATVDKWREEVMQLAPAVGRSATELADALFFITSAGIRDSAEAMEVLTQAAKASAIGLGETKTVANAVSSTLLAYASKGMTAAEATRVLVATVREGKLEAADLAGSIGRVLPLASQLGVKFADLGAFVATFTRLGVDSSEAVTSLRGALTALIKGTPTQTEALARLGITLKGLRQQIKDEGLAQALIGLVQKFKGNDEALREVIPRVRALAGVLGVAGEQGEEYLRIQTKMRKDLDEIPKGFKRVQETMAFTFGQLKADVGNLAIAFGDELAPAINQIVTDLNPLFVDVGNLIKGFAEWSGESKVLTVELTLLGIALGPIIYIISSIQTVLGLLVTGIGKFAAILVGGGTAAVVGWAAAVAALLPLANKLYDWLGEIRNRTIDWIQTKLPDWLAGMVEWVQNALNALAFLMPPNLLGEFWTLGEHVYRASGAFKSIAEQTEKFADSDARQAATDLKEPLDQIKLSADEIVARVLAAGEAFDGLNNSELDLLKTSLEETETGLADLDKTARGFVDALIPGTLKGMQDEMGSLVTAVGFVEENFGTLTDVAVMGLKDKLLELETVFGDDLPKSIQTLLVKIKELIKEEKDQKEAAKEIEKASAAAKKAQDEWAKTIEHLAVTQARANYEIEGGALAAQRAAAAAAAAAEKKKEWAKTLEHLNLSQARMNHEIEKGPTNLDKSTKAADHFSGALMDLANSFRVLGINANSTFGRIIAGAVNLGAAIPAIMDSSKSIIKDSELSTSGKVAGGAQAGAQGVAGVWSATSSGTQGSRALAGSMQGAAAGGQIGGPIGAGIGAAVGALVGFLRGAGPAKKMREIGEEYGVDISQGLAEEIHKSGKDIAMFLPQIIEEGLEAGISPAALTRNLSDVFKKVDEGVITTAEGVEALDGAFKLLIEDFDNLGRHAKTSLIDTMREAFDRGMETASMIDFLAQKQQEFTDKSKEGIEGLAGMFNAIGAGMEVSQTHFTGLGTVAFAMFEDLRAMGHTIVESLAMMTPAIDAAIAAAKEQGLQIEGPLARLIGLRNKVANNEPLVAAAEGLGAMFSALAQTGSLTQDTFDTLQHSAGATFEELIANGFTANQALSMMAPFLAQAQADAKKFGLVIDYDTQALIEQADAAGLLEGALSPQERMIELLERQVAATEALAGAFGVLPDAIGNATTAATEFDDATRNSDPWMSHVEGINAMALSFSNYAEEMRLATGAVGSSFAALGDGIAGATRRAAELSGVIRGMPPPPDIPDSGRSGNGGDGRRGRDGGDAAQHGLIISPRPGGKDVLAGEGGETELLAPVRSLVGQMSRDIAAALGGGQQQQIVVNVQLPGGTFYRDIEKAYKTNQLRVHPRALQEY